LGKAFPLIAAMRPKYWKAIDPDPYWAWRVADQGVRLVVRHAGLDSPDLAYRVNADPIGWAMEFYYQCSRQLWYAHAWGIETPNEPFPVWECTPEYIQFMSTLVRLFEVDGKQCIVGNFGTHQGPPPEVPGAKYYGVHAYFGRNHGWPDITAPGPYFLTECGFSDALGTDVPPGQDNGYGWQGRISADEYLSRLRELRGLSPGCLGAFVFQAGANPDWARFEILGTPVEECLDAADNTHEEDNLTMPEFKFGFKDLADRLGKSVVGTPVMDEQYVGDSLSIQFTTTGMMVHFKDAQGNHHSDFFEGRRSQTS